MVVAHHHSTVRVAENNLCTHIDELVDEEQSALEHLLMEEHAATCLCRHNEENRQEVGGKSWPWGIGKRHDGSIDKGIYDVVLLFRNKEVVALNLYLHTQSAESLGNDSQVADRHVLDAYTGSTHGSHTDERAHLDHIGQDAMLGSVKRLHAHDSKKVAAYAADLSAHGVEQMAELLDIRLAGCIIDGGGSLGKHRSHDDVGSTRNRSLVEQHIAALQFPGFYLIDIALVVVHELGTQTLESQEVGVETTAAYLVATRLGDGCLATASQQRTNHQHASTQRGALSHKLQAVEIVELQLVALECIVVATVLSYLHAYLPEQLDEVVHVEDVRHILDAHRLVGKDSSANHFECLVLGTLRNDGSCERMTAFYDK